MKLSVGNLLVACMLMYAGVWDFAICGELECGLSADTEQTLSRLHSTANDPRSKTTTKCASQLFDERGDAVVGQGLGLPLKGGDDRPSSQGKEGNRHFSGQFLRGSHSVRGSDSMNLENPAFGLERIPAEEYDASIAFSELSSLGNSRKGEQGLTKQRRRSRALLQQQGPPSSSSPVCPLDFSGMREFPYYAQTCRDPDHKEPNGDYSCCVALNSSFGQAESLYLRTSGKFRVEGNDTVAACVSNLTSELHREDSSLETAVFIPRCFPPATLSGYASDPSNCQGIETRTDFERLVGHAINTSLDTLCSGSLQDAQDCKICVDQAIKPVVAQLSEISPNKSDCLYYTLFYAAGISNHDGPYAQSTANCILAVKLPPNKSSGSKTLALHIAIGAIVALVAALFASLFFFLWWRRRKAASHRAFLEHQRGLLKTTLSRPNTGLIEYSFEEIKAATKNFSAKNYIGSGGFGDVFHGVLDDGLEVAVKRMKDCSTDGDADFVNEVNAINSVRHRNLVILRGCCVASTDADGHMRLLVYDYMVNGSLHDNLFQPGKPVLGWPDRRRVAVGMAKGINYLHYQTCPAIIHRDIKASNVLLDENMNAKVADFGLAKFGIVEQANGDSQAVAGTLGYVAPEYVLYGQLTEKSDVYSFGVVLLELMSGKSVLEGVEEGNFTLITDWAWAKVKEGKFMDVVDERITEMGPRDVMERFVLVGILCAHMLVSLRPTMEEALRYLEGDTPVPSLHNRPLPVNHEQLMRSPEFSRGNSPLTRSPLTTSPLTSTSRTPPRRHSATPSPSRAGAPSSPVTSGSGVTGNGNSAGVAAGDVAPAASEDEETEFARQLRAHRIAMAEYSGTSAGVTSAELAR